MDTEIVKRSPQTNYTDSEIELALRALALCSGNQRRAEETLAAHGRRVPQRTLSDWRRRYAERYERIQTEVMPEVYGTLAEHFEDFVDQAARVEMELLHDLEAKREQLEPKDIGTNLRNVSVSKGISTEKAMAMRGMPTQITVTADVTETLKALGRYASAVPTTAVEEPADS